MVDAEPSGEMLSEIREFEDLNLLIREQVLNLRNRKVDLRDRFDASRKKWQSVDHALSQQEVCTTLVLAVGSVLNELKEFEALSVGPRKGLMDALEKIPKRKVSKWQPVIRELNAANEIYFSESIPALIQLVDSYECAVGELERYVNINI
jgi:hypothetical protein